MAQIVGIFRLGRDAELRYTGSNEPVASLALAYNHGQKDQSGNRPSQWIDASLWGKRAESLAQHLTKGSQIYGVINDPHVETFKKRDGSEGVKLVGKVSEIEFAGGGRGAGNSQQAGEYAPAPAQTSQPSKPKPSFDDLGDDIPF